MSLQNYLQHGRRHGPHGSDPIQLPPGVAVASAYGDPTGTTIAGDNASHYISMHDGVSNAGFSTSHDEIFSNGSTTLFTGSPVYGIQIDATGTYSIYLNAFTISGGTSGKQVTASWSASDGSAPSFFQQGRSAQVTPDTWDKGQTGVGPHLFTHELMTVDDGQTGAVVAAFGAIEVGADVAMSFQLVVIQLTHVVLTKI